MSTIEKSREQPQQDPKSPQEFALVAVKNIQSLHGVDVNEAFPRMAELMETSDAATTFQHIANIAKVCGETNAAVDRGTTRQLCDVMDPDESPLLSLDHG